MNRIITGGLTLLVALFLLTGCEGLRTVRGTADTNSQECEASDFTAIDLDEE